MVEIKINVEKCVGCGTCADLCPAGVYELREIKGEKKSVAVNPDACLACRSCEANCPQGAIQVIE